MSKGLRALFYIIGGFIATIIIGILMFKLWANTSILRGQMFSLNWWIRKVIYGLMLAAVGACAWLVNEGYTYLERH